MESKPTYITTSWDDAHPLDLRLAERLAAFKLKGTFYVPIAYRQVPRMTAQQIRELHGMGMEIGSHTVTHPRLTRISSGEVLQELRDSKDQLEQMLGEEVLSFCYPEGKFRSPMRNLVREAGYAVGRTTIPFHTGFHFDPLAMPVTFQLLEHSRSVLARHVLNEGNYAGFWRWVLVYGWQRDLVKLTANVLDHIHRSGGVLHMWGHSWELEDFHLWGRLDELLEMITQAPNVRAMTNGELVETPVYA